MKHCVYCNKTYKKNEFRKNRSKCKFCEKIYGRKYSKINFEKRKNWRLNNKIKYQQLQKKWYEKHKKNIRKKEKSRYEFDKEFKKRKNISRVISNTFSKSGECKYWNCTYLHLVEWLLFTLNMNLSMNDYNIKWQQDHVIPKKEFKLFNNDGTLNLKNIKLCFSWYNVTAFSKISNQQKNKHINVEQLKEHVKRLKKFGSDVDSDYYDLCEKYIKENTNI
jgi:hypothetical protein